MDELTSGASYPLLNQRYRLEQQIVSGIHSQVWKATDTLRGLPVLLKSYLPAALHDWKHIQLIEREARVLSQINHIEIPGFVDFFTTGKESEQTLHLVTHWVNGMTLQDKLDTGWQISEKEVFTLATHVLELLVYLHAFNPPLVHRDIKPSNLMINEWGRVYLIDFGGAQEAMHASGTGGSTIVGTLGYMATEQVYGRAVPASDLYSLGVTLLHLLKGKNFSPSDPETHLQLLEELPMEHSQFKQWFRFLLAPDYRARYQSPEAALKDLDRLQNKVFEERTLFYPQNHKAQIPEIIHSLTLTQRDEQTQALASGSLLEGRYEIKNVLGSGTHSNVYIAIRLRDKQKVIIKELRLEQVSEWKNIELFEREIEIKKKLHHPRIPEFVDAFQLKERNTLSWFLVTGFVEGETLEQKILKGWRPTDEKVWQIASQLLEILEYLHGQKPPLVHRDIKPSNLIIDTEQNTHLIDFGAIQNRLWSQGGGGSTIIGTFGYMAPEQFSGNASAQSDLYGLGATLVRLLSNKHPIEIPMEITGLQFSPVVKCPPFYVQWLKHLLFPLPTQRFGSAKEARDLLCDAMKQGQKAQQWLAQQQHDKTEEDVDVFVKLLPMNISLSDIGDLFAGTAMNPAVHKEEVVLQPHEDTLLTKSLKNFKAEPIVVLHDEMMKRIAELHPPTNKEYLEQKETSDQIREKAPFIILALFSVIILIFVLPGLLSALAYDVQNGDYLGSVITLMSVCFIGWSVFNYYVPAKKTKAEQRDFIDRQQKGLLLPLSISEPSDSDQINREMLLKNNRLLLSDKGISLQTEGSKFIAWPQVQSLTFTPALPDYAHWHKLMSDRFFYLTFDYTEAQTSKTHVVLMALPPGDFSAIENAFSLLGEHYRKL